MPDLTTDVRYVKGIGEQRAKGLEKLGIRTLRDLISYFPRAYDDRRAYKKIKDLVDGENACVEALAAAAPTLNRIRKGLELVKLRAVDETGALDVTFFNQTYRKDNLHAGETYVFFGKAEASGRKRAMANPIVEREGERLQTGRIMPIYPLTAGISQLTLVKAMQQGLASVKVKGRVEPVAGASRISAPSTSPPGRRSLPWPGGGWCSRSCSSWPSG